MLDIKEKKIMIGEKEATIKIGEYAHQANGSVVLQCGETTVQAVVTMGDENPDLDFFPLQVEYNEGLYAGGIIKSSRFIKREGRPSDETIMRGRLIDRSIRPLFPKYFRREVQLIINVLSTDNENTHDILALNAAIAALAISDIPFDSHVGGIRLSKVNGDIVVYPSCEQCENQDYELVLAGNEKKIVMIECASNLSSDDEIIKGFEKSYEYLGKIAKSMDEIQKEFGKPKVEYKEFDVNQDIVERIKKLTSEKIDEYYKKLSSGEIGKQDFKDIVNEPILETFTDEEIEEYSKKEINNAIDKIFKKTIRENILKDKKRLDGRKTDEIREIIIKINPIPHVHGSSMFMRGETQVLNILTLAAPGAEQLMESIEGETKKRYIHHYNAPPYSVGETGRLGFTGRREIGHGGLAEKALKAVLPSQDEFPYVMRLVSEVMGQNGSSSMASTCASTITLMAGGVPIKEPVAGISIGLMTSDDEKQFVTLTDIRGVEDFSGDMDFKVAGTKDSITAIQMDTKIKGLTFEIVKKSIIQAKEARNEILEKMLKEIPEAKKDISENAPRIDSVKVPVDLIGKVVGPSGKVIKRIIADYGVDITIDDDGNATIAGFSKESIENAKNIILGIISEPEVGKVYNAKVVKIMDFGAFVEIFPGKEGLVHISKIAKERVNNVNDYLNMGDSVEVKLMIIDQQGRLNFSMLLDEPIDTEPPRNRDRKFTQTRRDHRR